VRGGTTLAELHHTCGAAKSTSKGRKKTKACHPFDWLLSVRVVQDWLAVLNRPMKALFTRMSRGTSR
jgi:hypothetical protein